MGGQKARYALMKLEKEHMENGGMHNHTKLYIPFDSPHHGANIPLFTQATYKTFKNTNIIAALANLSLVDPASRARCRINQTKIRKRSNYIGIFKGLVCGLRKKRNICTMMWRVKRNIQLSMVVHATIFHVFFL